MFADAMAIVLAAVLMAAGLVGTVLPILPGLWLMWAGGMSYGLITGLDTTAWIAIAVLTVIAFGGSAAAFAVPQREAASIGIPLWGQVVATITAVVGIFTIPVVGAPLGFLVGVVLVQWIVTRDLRSAPHTAWATVRSLLLASGLQFAAGLLMIATWFVWVLV